MQESINITSAQNRTWNAIFQTLSLNCDIINQYAKMVRFGRSSKTVRVTFEDQWGRFFAYDISSVGNITGMMQVEDFDGEHIQGFPLD